MTAQQQQHANEWLSSRDAAAFMGISDIWLRQLRQRKGGPPYYRIGRKIQYRSSDLDDYLATCRYDGKTVEPAPHQEPGPVRAHPRVRARSVQKGRMRR